VTYNLQDERELAADGFEKLPENLLDLGFGDMYIWIKKINRNLETNVENEETILNELKAARKQLKEREDDPILLDKIKALKLRLEKVKQESDFRDEYKDDPWLSVSVVSSTPSLRPRKDDLDTLIMLTIQTFRYRLSRARASRRRGARVDGVDSRTTAQAEIRHRVRGHRPAGDRGLAQLLRGHGRERTGGRARAASRDSWPSHVHESRSRRCPRRRCWTTSGLEIASSCTRPSSCWASPGTAAAWTSARP
jgi:hypothetical protein